MQVNKTWTAIAATGVIISACYMLWMYQRTFYGDTPDEVAARRRRWAWSSRCARRGARRRWPVPANLLPAAVEYVRLMPEIVLTFFAVAVMVFEGLSGEGEDKQGLANLSLLGLLAALWGTVAAWSRPGTAFYGMIAVDGFATFFRALVLAAGILTVLCSSAYLRRERANKGEYYALLLLSITGQSLMVSANELIIPHRVLPCQLDRSSWTVKRGCRSG